MLSLSTAWNYKEDINVRDLLSEIKKTGVDSIELGYRVTRSQLEDIIDFLPEINLKVGSIHNFCPVPCDGPSPRHPSNYYRLSALEEEERHKAVHWTKNSIDTALRVKADVVVIHAGTVEMDEARLKNFLEMYRAQRQDTDEFRIVRAELLRERREKQPAYFQALVKTLDEVMAYARQKNVKIGLETRYYLHEIPNCDEVGILLDKYHDQGMFYWHDVGHAEINERLGIAMHLDYLKKYSPRMIGWHIHGVKTLKDHHAPFEGDFNILKVVPFIKADHVKVIESHTGTVEQIQKAVHTLSSLGKKE